MSHLRYVHPTDLVYDVRRGIYPGKSVVSVLGANTDVDAPDEDLIPWGGNYAFQTAAVAMEAISSSASDDGSPAGVGARTITVFGLNGSFAEISESVVLNGVTAVPLVNTYRRINFVVVDTVGSTGSNVGSVDVRVTAGAVIQSRVIPGEGVSRAGVYTIPASKIAYIESSNGSLYRTSNEAISVVIFTRDQSTTDKSLKIAGFGVIIAHGNTVVSGDSAFDRIVGPCDIWMRAMASSGANNGVYGRINLILEDA